MTKRPARLPLRPRQLVLIAGIAMLVLFLFGYTSRLIASSELQDEVALWQEEVRLEEKRLQANQERLAYSQTDQYVIERAHSDLGWTFPNEVAVWVLGEESGQSEPAQVAENALQPYWQQWQQRFSGRPAQ